MPIGGAFDPPLVEGPDHALEAGLDLDHGVSGHLRSVHELTPDLNAHPSPTLPCSAYLCTLRIVTAQ